MKKILLGLIAISAVLFASCGAKVEKDECGCFETISAAKAEAMKSNKNIIFMITAEGSDIISDAFVQNVVKSEEFQNSIAQDYVILHLDASEKGFNKAIASPEATKEEQKAAEKYEKILNDKISFAMSIGGGSYSPQFFLLTKETYPITEVYYEDFEDQISTEDFSALIHSHDEEVAMTNALIEATKTGTKEEKIDAIDNVYSTVNEFYKLSYYDLWKEAVALDKKNTTGKIGKYIYSVAEAEAANAFSNDKVDESVKILTKAAENPALDGEAIQQCYYLSAYLLTSTGSSDSKVIADLLKKSYDAAPDTEIAPQILATAEYYSNFEENEINDLDFSDLGIDNPEELQSDSTPSEITE